MPSPAAPRSRSIFDKQEEVRLARPPLVSVVAQLKFPPVVSIARQDFIAPFQEALRDRYPILRAEREVGFVVGPKGVAATPNAGEVVWRLTSPSHPWRVSLGPAFVAVDTQNYTTRTDLLQHLRRALDALAALITPAVFDRLGVRYSNRLQSEDEVRRLPELVRPELLSILPVVSSAGIDVVHSLSESLLSFGDEKLLLRWGLFPAGTTIDPSLQSVGTRSWLLDLDMFVEKSAEFDADRIVATADSFATRTYSFFRWAVTDALIRERQA